ncbi:hypothetical protein [Phreatobacter sp.]|uniref:hypothetical protein n=1 Tax=Phreatobacter sp. TaxID=1966341 RepID=UPI003F70A195
MEIVLAPDVFVRMRDTPWDARAFGRPTRDITDLMLACETGNAVGLDDDLFHRLAERLDADGVGLVTARLPADRRAAIGRLQAAGFRYVETAYRLGLRNLGRYEPPARITRRVALREAVAADHAALIEQAADSFRYGRFAEDPQIDPALNRRRQIDWMEGLLAGRARVWVAEVDGGPGAFMAFRTEGAEADLILAGTRPKLGILAYPLWIAVIDRLRAEGIERARTVISAANLGVVNLYGTLGFRFEEALVGLHLHRS